MGSGPDLTVAIPTLNERENVEHLVPLLWEAIRSLGITGEILVLDGASTDGTCDSARRLGARPIDVPTGGYGEATRVGLREARGEYVVTMDADLSHEPQVVARLWAARDPRAIGIASRYAPGGSAAMSRLRWFLSRVLNIWFARGLALPVRDLSSGFRIYPASVAVELEPVASDFDILPELLVRAYAAGWRIVEIPFHYAPRQSGSSKARILRLGRAYVRTFTRLWRLRRSIAQATKGSRPAPEGR